MADKAVRIGIFCFLSEPFISPFRSWWFHRQFTDTALGFSTGLLNAAVDLVSFSGILYTIYPPLFIALLLYSLGGTAISLRLGRPLVGLNFQQEAREADFRSAMQASIFTNESESNAGLISSTCNVSSANVLYLHC